MTSGWVKSYHCSWTSPQQVSDSLEHGSWSLDYNPGSCRHSLRGAFCFGGVVFGIEIIAPRGKTTHIKFEPHHSWRGSVERNRQPVPVPASSCDYEPIHYFAKDPAEPARLWLASDNSKKPKLSAEAVLCRAQLPDV